MSNDANEPFEPFEPFDSGDGKDPDRNEKGQFRPGWKGGPGSPVAKQAKQLRDRLHDALFKTCSADRLLAAIDAALKKAETGDLMALRFLCERISAPPVSTEAMERIEALEAAAKAKDT
jgi:hypothetical protein